MKIPTPEFIKNDELNDDEKELLRCALAGEGCVLGDGSRPKPDDQTAPAIDAKLIRFLARGGNNEHPVDPYGVRLAGARITGTLTLEGCRNLRTLSLNACHFDATPTLHDAAGQVIDFGGSYLPGLVADRLTTTGSVFLRQGFETAGPVRLVGAKIGGNLECTGSKFLGKDEYGNALIADRLTTTGSLFLNDGFEAAGAVWLVGAKIGGNLACVGGKFSGKPSALVLQKGCVTGIFFWKMAKGDRPTGTVDLWSAEVGDLSDDLESWPEGGVVLDGFRYRRISDAPTSYAARKDWLERQRREDLTNDFKPQPFEQLAKVLREMGHAEDAKRIAILKQQYERRANWLQARARIADAGQRLADTSAARRTSIDAEEIMRLDADIREARWTLYREPIGWRARWLLHRLFGLIVGYGYRPLYALGWLMVFVFLGWWIFAGAYDAGGMVPNDPRTLRSEGWLECADRAANPAECWLTEKSGEAVDGGGKLVRGRDYPPFDPLWYALDTFVPFVNLHQESRWIPDPESGGGTGWWARLYLYLHIAIGWIITALAAASLTGLVKKDV